MTAGAWAGCPHCGAMVLNSYEGWTRHQTTCPDPALLTPLEAAQLPEGATVEVTWSGGNGPHQYEVHLGPGEQPYAGDVRNDNPLTGLEAFVGDRPYHTHVRRIDRGGARDEALVG